MRSLYNCRGKPDKPRFDDPVPSVTFCVLKMDGEGNEIISGQQSYLVVRRRLVFATAKEAVILDHAIYRWGNF